MKYLISIIKVEADVADEKIYEQVVENLDLLAVMAAVNRKPRKPRTRNTKDDK